MNCYNCQKKSSSGFGRFYICEGCMLIHSDGLQRFGVETIYHYFSNQTNCDGIIKYFESIKSSATSIIQKTISNGLSCFKCKEFYPFAEPNQGDKLVCFSCRTYPHYGGMSED